MTKKAPSIVDIITKDLIQLKVSVNNCDEAIRRSGEILLKSGVIEERYITGMLNLFRELGPYIVVAPGIAIPHARPEDGAKKVGFSVITLRNPVAFGHKENDPVRLVIAFASPGNELHVRVLGQLAEFLQNRDDVERIMEAEDAEDVVNIHAKYKSVKVEK